MTIGIDAAKLHMGRGMLNVDQRLTDFENRLLGVESGKMPELALRTFRATEGQSVFILTDTIDPGHVKVEVDGEEQDRDVNYTITLPSTITLSEGLPAGSEVDIWLYGSSAVMPADGLEPATQTFYASNNQTIFTLTNAYNVGKNQLIVEVDGVKQTSGSGYTETDPNTITLSEGLAAGAKVVVRTYYYESNVDQRFNQLESDTSVNLSEKVSYPVLSVETGKVVNKTKIYGHVERYGAVNDGVVDCSDAVQTAINIMEELAKGTAYYSSGFFKVQFGSGDYVIRKTIWLKYDKTTQSTASPITIVGNERKRVADQLGKGTVIRPLIPNYTGKTYASVFAINIKKNSDIDEDDSIAFDTQPLQTVNSIMIKDISFTLTDDEALTYNICAIKGYRFRMDAQNLLFTNMWRGIWQPETDRLNNFNYCDFSTFENLSFTYTKLNCLELYTPDSSSVKSIYNHRPKSTFDSVIKVKRGSITIDNVTHSLHGDYDVNGVFVPRNDGTGQTGTKAVIKLIECAASVRLVYCERPLTDYVFHLTDVVNFSLDDYSGKFVGNGFISINGTCRNIAMQNVKRFENLVSEYTDFYVASGATFTGLKVKNFLPRTYYSDSIALATPLTGLTAIADSTFTTRDIKHNFTFNQYKHIEGETITFLLKYDGANWTTTDVYGNSMTNALGTFAWSTDGISFVGSKLSPCRIISVQEGHVDDTTLPHVPIIRGFNIERIRFFDRSTGALVTTLGTKMSVWVTVNCILNMTKLL